MKLRVGYWASGTGVDMRGRYLLLALMALMTTGCDRCPPSSGGGASISVMSQPTVWLANSGQETPPARKGRKAKVAMRVDWGPHDLPNDSADVT